MATIVNPRTGATLDDPQGATLAQLAEVVYLDWSPVNYAAAPYLDAMRSLGSMADTFGADSARSVVAYFLNNASSWRGPVARAVKSELRARLATR
jgi:hypothetical protein